MNSVLPEFHANSRTGNSCTTILLLLLLIIIIIIIIDNFCIVIFSGVHKLTALYNILQHFLSFTNITDIIID